MAKKLAIIAAKGTLDDAYPPFILASTGSALGFEVQVYCTFYGLALLRKQLDLPISSLGNPAMPMPFPMPVLVQALPGMEWLMKTMLKRRIREKRIASLTELRQHCIEGGVKFIACNTAMGLFDLQPNDFIDSVVVGGAATFLAFASEADVTLYI